MTIRVIGAGFGRNGTMSLKVALERLGFEKCYHMFELNQEKDHDLAWLALSRGEAVDFDELLEGYQATVDWPSCNFWRQQLEAYTRETWEADELGIFLTGLRSHQILGLGDRVVVEVADASVVRRQVDLAYVDRIAAQEGGKVVRRRRR